MRNIPVLCYIYKYGVWVRDLRGMWERYLWFLCEMSCWCLRYAPVEVRNVPVVFCVRHVKQVPVVSSVFGSFNVSNSSAACSRTHSLRGGGQVGQTYLTHIKTAINNVPHYKCPSQMYLSLTYLSDQSLSLWPVCLTWGGFQWVSSALTPANRMQVTEVTVTPQIKLCRPAIIMNLQVNTLL